MVEIWVFSKNIHKEIILLFRNKTRDGVLYSSGQDLLPLDIQTIYTASGWHNYLPINSKVAVVLEMF